MKEHFSPLALEPPLLSSSPSPYLLLSSHSMLSSDGVRGGRETWRSAQELGAEYRSAAGGNWCPGYLAYVIDPELEKKNPALSLPTSPALLSLLTGICSDIISWPVGVMPQPYQVMSLLNHHSRRFPAASAALHNKIKSLTNPLCSVLYPPEPHPQLPLPFLSSCCCQLKNRVHWALTIERKGKSFHLWRYKNKKGIAKEWSPVPVDFNHLRLEPTLVFNIPWWPHEQWKGLTRFHCCLLDPRGTLKSVLQFRGILNRWFQ